MKEVIFNDEENAIMDGLKTYPLSEQIKTLEDSIIAEDEPSNQRMLHSLLLKLKGA